MKKLLTFFIILIVLFNHSYAESYNKPTIDNSISISTDDWDSDEEFLIISEPYPGNTSNDSIFIYFTFDEDNLYFGFKTGGEVNFDSGWEMALSIDPDPLAYPETGSDYFTYKNIDYGLGIWENHFYTLTLTDPWEYEISRTSINNPTEIKIAAVIFDGTTSTEYYYQIDDSVTFYNARASWPEFSYGTIKGTIDAMPKKPGSDLLERVYNGIHQFNEWHGWVLKDGLKIDDSFPRNPSDQSLPIELSQFTARAENEHVVLEWTTESEVNNIGFNLYRSETSNSDYKKINSKMIPGAINASEPNNYSFVDNIIETNNRYYYKLQDVAGDLETEMHGPYSVEVKKSAAVADGYKLYDCYPNPFNPTTNIVFDVKEATRVNINIYDINGTLIRQMTHKKYSAGRHQVTWNGRDENNAHVSAGIYFTVMQTANGFTQSSKMVFVK